MTPAVSVARWSVVGLNVLAAAGCVALAALAPSRAAMLLAGGGFVFFALAAAGFGALVTLARRSEAPRRAPRFGLNTRTDRSLRSEDRA